MPEAGKPRIGITMGDPAGIGPEIAVQALCEPAVFEEVSPVIIGDAGVIRRSASVVGVQAEVVPIRDVRESGSTPDRIAVFDLANVDLDRVPFGHVSAVAGRAAFECVEKAIRLAMAGEIEAVVTGPIHKEALHAAGYPYAGHTEIFRDLTGAEEGVMMLAFGNFRVAHVSTHVSLRRACDLVSRIRVLNVIRVTNRALVELGLEQPRIAVAGLNPHAGEGGLFGREEIDEIIPAVAEARSEGIDANGPHPPDTIYARASGGQFDAVIAMYHDQGHIPLKLAGFKLDEAGTDWKSVAGINITLGLPIIRVSVDHGTAFDRAGKGTSSCESLLDAIRMAARLARARRSEVKVDPEGDLMDSPDGG